MLLLLGMVVFFVLSANNLSKYVRENISFSVLISDEDVYKRQVLGCMAERVKDDLIENHHVDLVVGPDAYLTLPDLVIKCALPLEAYEDSSSQHVLDGDARASPCWS